MTLNMTPFEVEAVVAAHLQDGWEIVASGRVLIPFEAKYPKPSFAERVEGFHGVAPGEKLFDDDERWVQLRKPKTGASA